MTYLTTKGTCSSLNSLIIAFQPFFAGASVTTSPLNTAYDGCSDFNIERIVDSVSMHPGDPGVQCISVN